MACNRHGSLRTHKPLAAQRNSRADCAHALDHCTIVAKDEKQAACILHSSYIVHPVKQHTHITHSSRDYRQGRRDCSRACHVSPSMSRIHCLACMPSARLRERRNSGLPEGACGATPPRPARHCSVRRAADLPVARLLAVYRKRVRMHAKPCRPQERLHYGLTE